MPVPEAAETVDAVDLCDEREGACMPYGGGVNPG